ncbi:polysaccharide biosynthesis/export family protein [Alteromonas oceanisediminis]|uniref:polysaccharide biosynthesis/export family protein n=1 Tax=Alteromonas oceanisediminis TaxID=2836180 RepID=UPI001BD922ED|nr:polysaccharide biosynthesis/export family protein [Alteromonas oceanisediminis]MBT0585063.1 polysaccharide biosynthesis/export family protein [Alteromonas oceanisediminis]
MKSLIECRLWVCLIFSLPVFSANIVAQTLTQQQLQQAQLASQSQQVDLSQYIQSDGRSSGRYITQSKPPVTPSPSEHDAPKPFGANLFKGGYVAERSDGLNSQYRVAPGDKIAIQMWGAVVRSQVVTVDNQGNIFVPEVGPILVSNVPAVNLNNVVTSNIKRIYPNNVNVYVNLLTATPVSVFVAGPVERPGQYAGLASDSVLFFLTNAGGIDSKRGSYRHVSVLRNGEKVISYDIYEFLKHGDLPSFSFKDDDVILVAEQGPMVTVEGSARYPFRFELTPNNRSGSDLVRYSRPLKKTTHVAVTGNRESGPISIYVPYKEFINFEVEDGDVVLFNDDIRPQVISVQLSGSYEGPSFYTLQKGTRLNDLLSHIQIDPESANYKNVYIKRESVVEQQKFLIEQSLQRLERSIFTAPASSDGEAVIRAQEAELVAQFIERARKVEPLGKVVVADNNNVANIRLEQGDEIIIPEHTDLIQVSGEVLMPQALVFNQNASIGDYIAWAAGYTERADPEQIIVVQANGLSRFVTAEESSYWFSDRERYVLQPGDQILVLPKVDSKLMQSVKDITQILYQIAITANVAID